MANNKNLKKGNPKTQFKSGQKAAESGSKGGIASGIAKREKKAMKDTLATLLSMPLNNNEAADIETIQSVAALKGKNITVQEAIMLAQVQKAIKGDTKAAEFIRDSSGNKIKEELSLSGTVNNPFADLTTEQLMKLIGDD